MQVVEIQLLDGVCFTTQETLDRICLPWMLSRAPAERYIGRPKVEFEYVMDLVRNGDEELQDDCHHEVPFLYGLDGTSPGPVVLLNVGGVLFHLREAVARRIPYLDATIRWQPHSLADLSHIFIDRNPTKFNVLREYVETSAPDPSLFAAPGMAKEAMFWGVDLPSPCLPALAHTVPADATLSLLAFGMQDVYFNADPTVTVHAQKVEPRMPKSAFTFHSTQLVPEPCGADTGVNGCTWKATLPMTCDALGDCWVSLDIRVSPDAMPSDLWARCEMVDKVTFTLDGYCQETTGATLFTFMAMAHLHEAVVVSANATVTRLVVPLPTYWFGQMGVKPQLAMLEGPCTVACHMATPWTLAGASLTYTAWYYSSADKQARGDNAVLVHDTVSFSTPLRACSFIHTETLSFHGLTRDIIVLVKGRQGQTEPVVRMDLLLNGTVHMSIDGGFARRVIPQHLYGFDNTHPLYIIPFDNRHRTCAIVSTSACNLKGMHVQLRLQLLPGQYDVFVTARVINHVKHVYRRLGMTCK